MQQAKVLDLISHKRRRCLAPDDVCSRCATMLPSTPNPTLFNSLVAWIASLMEDQNRAASSSMLGTIQTLLEPFVGTTDAPVATAGHQQAVWI